MTRKDVLELKRRIKKEDCSIRRMAGCYVNAQKEKVVTLNEIFENLPDDEFFKYLEIAKKSLSGGLGNNLLELSFQKEPDKDYSNPEQEISKNQFFLGLVDSELKQEDLLDRFYDFIIESYDYAGNYLILLYHDIYDVMVKTEDGRKIDESEEVYSYMICALCPVTLSKPGLGYLEDEKRIGVRMRDWIVGMPENGFLFPAFTDRSSDIHSLLFYTKNPKEPHLNFMEDGLGCEKRRTGTQQKKAFENVIKKAIAGSDLEGDEVFLSIQETLNDIALREEETKGKDAPSPLMTQETIQEIIQECEIDEYIAPKIQAAFEEEFTDAIPSLEAVLDTKLLAKNEQKKKEKEWAEERASLNEEKKQLSEEKAVLEEEIKQVTEKQDLCDVFLRLKPERANKITSRIIDGQKCLLIPVEDGDDIDINGIKMDPTL